MASQRVSGCSKVPGMLVGVRVRVVHCSGWVGCPAFSAPSPHAHGRGDHSPRTPLASITDDPSLQVGKTGLFQAEIKDKCVVCPAHGTYFDLRSAPLQGRRRCTATALGLVALA
jgi:hypothetical protein